MTFYKESQITQIKFSLWKIWKKPTTFVNKYIWKHSWEDDCISQQSKKITYYYWKAHLNIIAKNFQDINKSFIL